MWKKLLLTASLIFLVGLFISWYPFYHLTADNLHFAGVLQRIAVSYVIAAAICVPFRRGWIAAAASLILLECWALIASSGGSAPYTKEVAFDHGINYVAYRSCLSSAVLIIIGFLEGSLAGRPRYSAVDLPVLTGIGLAMVLLGKLWLFEFPIIKSLLWSSSHVLFTAGIATLMFTLCLWVIEMSGFRSWAFPFVLFGLNPVILYAVSILLDKLTWINSISGEGTSISLHDWLYQSYFQPLAADVNASLLYAVTFVVIHWIIAYWWFRRRIFIKL